LSRNKILEIFLSVVTLIVFAAIEGHYDSLQMKSNKNSWNTYEESSREGYNLEYEQEEPNSNPYGMRFDDMQSQIRERIEFPKTWTQKMRNNDNYMNIKYHLNGIEKLIKAGYFTTTGSGKTMFDGNIYITDKGRSVFNTQMDDKGNEFCIIPVFTVDLLGDMKEEDVSVTGNQAKVFFRFKATSHEIGGAIYYSHPQSEFHKPNVVEEKIVYFEKFGDRWRLTEIPLRQFLY